MKEFLIFIYHVPSCYDPPIIVVKSMSIDDKSPLWEDLKDLDTLKLPVYPSFSPTVLDHLIWLAQQSPCQTSKHAAAVMVTRRIPLSYGYNSTFKGAGNRPCGHAEEVAIRSVLNTCKQNKRKKYFLLVIRVDRSGKLTLSRPCSNCIQALKRTGMFDRIFYSNVIGQIVMEKLANMEMYHFSRGHLKFGINQ